MHLTPIHRFDGWCAKREDMACWVSLDHPSGSKVRQYMAMAKQFPGVPMIVGCASYSCMQIYVASAAKLTGVDGYVHVPQRKQYTEATWYAIKMGATMCFEKPAYMNVLRSRAKAHAKKLGQVVRWLPQLALKDAAEQAQNIPPWVRRVVIPTGSGLTAAGVLAGLAKRERPPKVVAVAVSSLADEIKIREMAWKMIQSPAGELFASSLPPFELVRHKWEYGRPWNASLPDDTPLDPYYAAKAKQEVQKGDCFWLPGLRPVCSFPSEFKRTHRDWKGFK